MFGSTLAHTASEFLDITREHCVESGGSRWTVSATRRSPACHTVYVGHPISGIRVARVREMQESVVAAFARLTGGTGRTVQCLFPMRTTHLRPDDLGANEYPDSTADFSDTRHFTLQNRMDAVTAADGVLINLDLADDLGAYRVSKGIPFDYGWAAACGTPVVAVVPEGNPNACAALSRAAAVTRDLEHAVAEMNVLLGQSRRTSSRRVIAEVFDFTGSGSALSMIARLASTDAAKHRDGGRAIISVIPEGREAACWHGQVAQVSDWVVPDLARAERIVAQLAGC